MEKKLVLESWKDVSISTYKQLCDIDNREFDSDLEKQIARAAIVLGMDEKDMYDLSVSEMQNMLSKAEWLYKPFEFDLKWHKKTIKINDKVCKVFQNIESLSVAQYLDFQNFWQDKDNNQGNVMACFFVPEGHKYGEGYDVREFAEEIENTLSIEEWNAFAFFLLKSWLISIRCSVRYGIWTIQKMIWKEKNPERKKELKQARKELIRQLRRFQ